MANAVDEIMNKQVLRAALLSRFENSEIRKMQQLLTPILRDIELKIAARIRKIKRRGFDTGPATTKRLKKLQKDIRKIISKGFQRLSAELAAGLNPLADSEIAFAVDLLEGAMPINITFLKPNAEALRTIVTAQPFEGEILRHHFRNIGARLQSKALQQLRIGLIEGETTDEIVRRISGIRGRRGVFGTTRRQVSSIVRTAVTHVANGSREALYAKNLNVIKGVQWVATLDSVTCPECGGLDGQVFKPFDGIRPPAHHQCRCTTIPVLKSWKELGIKLPEAPPGTRASLDGQVAARLNFNGWLRKQPASIQDDVLGETRARLFRAGKANMRSFSAPDGRLLTLKELDRKLAA